MSDGLRLGVRQEQRLRDWPKERIRPKSVALGVMSLLAEVEALRRELGAVRQAGDALAELLVDRLAGSSTLPITRIVKAVDRWRALVPAAEGGEGEG